MTEIQYSKPRPFPVFLIQLIALVALISAATGCGGGGGGGGGSSSQKGVRVLHAAVDAAPVDLVSSASSEGILQTARFAVAGGYSRVPDGAQTLSVFRTKSSSSPLYTENRTIGSDDRLSVFLFGMLDAGGLTTVVINDALPEEIPSGSGALQVFHGAFGASGVDVQVNGSQFASAVPYGTSSGYSVVGAGELSVTVRRTADKKVIASTKLFLEDRRSATVLVAGEVDYFVKAVPFEG